MITCDRWGAAGDPRVHWRYRFAFLRRGWAACVLLLGALLPAGPGLAGAPDWGTGFYRLNPAQEPAFTSEQNRLEEERRRTDRSFRPQTEPLPRTDFRKAPPPEWPDRREPTDSRRRYDSRPWGEVPPEWRNEDLDRRLPREREGVGGTRRSSRYYDGPEEPLWPPEGELRSHSWDYPYWPERDYRRRDPSVSPYYYEDRFGSGGWNTRRRLPPYYYEGGEGWWEAP